MDNPAVTIERGQPGVDAGRLNESPLIGIEGIRDDAFRPMMLTKILRPSVCLVGDNDKVIEVLLVPEDCMGEIIRVSDAGRYGLYFHTSISYARRVVCACHHASRSATEPAKRFRSQTPIPETVADAVCCHSLHCDQPGGQIGADPYSASQSGHSARIAFGADSIHRPV